MLFDCPLREVATFSIMAFASDCEVNCANWDAVIALVVVGAVCVSIPDPSPVVDGTG
jgi:hypothetical protein